MDDLDRLYRRLVHNIRSNRPEYLQIPFTVRDLYEQIIPYRHNRRELAIDTNDDYEVAVARLLSGERGYLQGDPALQEGLRKELASPTGDPGVFKDHADSTVSLTPVANDARTPVTATAAVGMKTPVASTAGAAPTIVPATAPAAAPATRPTIVPTSTSTGSPAIAPKAQPEPPTIVAAQPSAAPRPASQTPSEIPRQPPSQSSAQAVSGVPAPQSVAHEQPVPSLLSSLSHIEVPTGCRFCGGTLPEGREANYCPHCGENLRTKRCPSCGAEMDTSWGYCVTCGRKGG